MELEEKLAALTVKTGEKAEEKTEKSPEAAAGGVSAGPAGAAVVFAL